MKKLLLLMLLFTVTVKAEIIINNPTPIVVCDDNNDGFSNFDLTTRTSEILGSLSPSDYILTYYETEDDAIAGVNAFLEDPTNYANNATNVVFVRVEEVANPSNYSLTFITLIVNNTPFAPLNIPNLVISEFPFDSIALFNLNGNENFILGSQTNITLEYYLLLEDAQADSNQILNTTNFAGTNLQVIWVRIQNTIGSCIIYRSFVLRVYDTSDIVNIPDANFKQRLLAANSVVAIAFDQLGAFVSIDVNNDGEIQVSETGQIYGLDLSNAGIIDLTGVQSFLDLETLNCTLNQVVNLESINTLSNIKNLKCLQCSLSSINVAPLTNLEVLQLSENNLTALNLTGLSKLTSLSCENNTLASISFEPSIFMTNLSCQNNQLLNLDVSEFPNLATLSCNNNQLTTIDLSNNNLLTTLFIGNSSFNGVEVTNMPNLNFFELKGSLQTSLDLANNPTLSNLTVQNTNINELDLSATAVTAGYIRENTNLSFLSLKNGSFITFGAIINNPNLNYVCIDESQIIALTNFLINPVSGNNINVVVNSYCSFVPGGDYNTISGRITFDMNGNGCDTSDIPKPNMKVNINDGTNSGATFTGDNGLYKFFTSTGSFTLTPQIENSTLFNISPTSAIVTFSSNNNLSTEDFCLSVNGIVPDIEVTVAPTLMAIPGSDAIYQVVYKNKGNQILSGDVTFNFNDSVSDFVFSSEAPTTNVAGILTWNYSSLQPFESRVIYVRLNLNSATDIPPVNVGDQLEFTATANPIIGDVNSNDNTFVYNEIVQAVYNPNNIICIQGSTNAVAEIGNYMHYMINFENTGIAPAQNVVLRLEVDDTQYNLQSLQVLATSNESYTRINGNTVEFIFCLF